MPKPRLYARFLDKRVFVALHRLDAFGAIALGSIDGVCFIPRFKKATRRTADDAAPGVRCMHVKINPCNVAANFGARFDDFIFDLKIACTVNALFAFDNAIAIVAAGTVEIPNGRREIVKIALLGEGNAMEKVLPVSV